MWIGFQIFRRRICKIQKLIWLAGTNEILKFPPREEPVFKQTF